MQSTGKRFISGIAFSVTAPMEMEEAKARRI
jgi:hypothetical protein